MGVVSLGPLIPRKFYHLCEQIVRRQLRQTFIASAVVQTGQEEKNPIEQMKQREDTIGLWPRFSANKFDGQLDREPDGKP